MNGELAGVSEKSRCGIAAAEYNRGWIIAGLYCMRKERNLMEWAADLHEVLVWTAI